ncbi:hypothetical protein P280DRAFT_193898 [Massarina eburnea CBS 473.64]|uniref:Uncharacterized protein n=1 Tax=Massarina eburnea CBS 473.64 TaxID=1395130 RepID=A0A6A6RK68_9PLEO|nr:hypothetical protein P280DRAFT_193898 [Massarina eburnea CBS 473.64]
MSLLRDIHLQHTPPTHTHTLSLSQRATKIAMQTSPWTNHLFQYYQNPLHTRGKYRIMCCQSHAYNMSCSYARGVPHPPILPTFRCLPMVLELAAGRLRGSFMLVPRASAPASRVVGLRWVSGGIYLSWIRLSAAGLCAEGFALGALVMDGGHGRKEL